MGNPKWIVFFLYTIQLCMYNVILYVSIIKMYNVIIV